MFYNGLTYATMLNVYAAASGALMGKSAEEAQHLIEEIVANSFQSGIVRDNLRWHASMFEVDGLQVTTDKLEELSRKIDKQIAVGQGS